MKLTSDERKILKTVSRIPESTNKISIKANMSNKKTMIILMRLELKGKINRSNVYRWKTLWYK